MGFQWGMGRRMGVGGEKSFRFIKVPLGLAGFKTFLLAPEQSLTTFTPPTVIYTLVLFLVRLLTKA